VNAEGGVNAWIEASRPLVAVKRAFCEQQNLVHDMTF
jgi:hypothetical protein